jgi:hypothetical protein
MVLQAAPIHKCVPRKDPNASSFSFGDDSSAPALSAHQMRQKKREFNDNRIGSGLGGSAQQQQQPQVQYQPQPQYQNQNQNQNMGSQQQGGGKAGFGDTGASCVKVQAPPGGRSSGNIIGGWN